MQKLSDVTRAIIRLFEDEVGKYVDATDSLSVVPTPPDPDTSGFSLHVYLYHVKECPFNKNLPSPGGAGPIPIQHTPLYLVLQYVISAVHTADEGEYDEQSLIGYVARVIHDYPILTGETRTSANRGLDGFIQPGCEIEIILRPAPPEETVAFYSAGQQEGLRLSLFVEARVALLEPDPPETTLPGIVLSLGTTVAPMDLPTLVGTRARLQLARPLEGSTGYAVVKNEVSPGRVSLFAPGYTPTLPSGGYPAIDLTGNNRLLIDTSKMLSGDLELVLEGNRHRVRVPLSWPDVTNPDWNFQLEPRTLACNVMTEVTGYLDKATVLGSCVLRPGLYSAQVLLRALDGSLRMTNKVPFFLSPEVDEITTTDGVTYTIRISGSYLALPTQDNPFDATEIQISIGKYGFKLSSAATTDTGTFTLLGDGTGIVVQLPPLGNALRPAGRQPILLMVNGVPALPQWIEVSA